MNSNLLNGFTVNFHVRPESQDKSDEWLDWKDIAEILLSIGGDRKSCVGKTLLRHSS